MMNNNVTYKHNCNMCCRMPISRASYVGGAFECSSMRLM